MSDPKTSSARRPTTPLRRLSASSLRSASLSASRTRTSTQSPLEHLGPVFAELSDAISDLAGNFQQLDKVNSNLEGFNEAFAGYLYGLRMNAYTVNFDEIPNKDNFALSTLLAQESASSLAQQQQQHPPTPPRSPSPSADTGNETTFVSQQEQDFSFAGPSTRGSARGRGTTGIARGRGTGRVVSAQARKKKEEMNAFTDSLLALLPLKYREQQPHRQETEKVIASLRTHPDGLSMAAFGDLMKKERAPVPSHRINDSLTALVRAKLAIKAVVKGTTVYKLDPAKYPPTA